MPSFNKDKPKAEETKSKIPLRRSPFGTTIKLSGIKPPELKSSVIKETFDPKQRNFSEKIG
jgi:hypothetical protein